jgi:hypothetical protein
LGSVRYFGESGINHAGITSFDCSTPALSQPFAVTSIPAAHLALPLHLPQYYALIDMGSPILRTRFMWSCFRGMRFSRRPTRLAEYIGIRTEVVVPFGRYGLNEYGYESNKPNWTNKSFVRKASLVYYW